VTGPAEIVFEFVTNDPDQPRLLLTLKANVKPLPEFVSRMDRPELATGQQEGGFRFWPAAHPRFNVEVGETLEFSLRATMQNPYAVVGPQTPAVANDATASRAQALPPGSVKVKVRPAGRDDGYWLDVKVGPINKSGLFESPLAIPVEAGDLARDVAGSLDVTLMVVDSSVVITPREIDLGELSISSLTGQVGVMNVRKLFGTFKVLDISSCAMFLKFDVQPLIKEKNYSVRIRAEGGRDATLGRIECPVLIRTDDPRHPSIEAPLKAVLVP
jgi:hypothetical protein